MRLHRFIRNFDFSDDSFVIFDKEIFNQIKDILSQYPGEQGVELNLVQSNGQQRTIITSAKVKKTPELLDSLKTICGPEATVS